MTGHRGEISIGKDALRARLAKALRPCLWLSRGVRHQGVPAAPTMRAQSRRIWVLPIASQAFCRSRLSSLMIKPFKTGVTASMNIRCKGVNAELERVCAPFHQLDALQ